MFRQLALTIDLPPGDYQVTDVVSWPARLAVWLERPVTVRIPRWGWPARWRVLAIVLVVLAAVLWGEMERVFSFSVGQWISLAVFSLAVFSFQRSGLMKKGVGS